MNNQKNISELLNGQKIVPVVVIEDDAQALGLPQALIDGGITVIEITLRSEFAISAISKVKTQFPEMTVLAGTVTSAEQLVAAVEAGAEGIISPGFTEALAEQARKSGVPYLPGVATASEILLANQHGITEFKLFPANIAGGVGALKGFAGPFQDFKFCPTGGVSADNYQEFLALDNVMCVGGSWLAPKQATRAGDWSAITKLCKDALSA